MTLIAIRDASGVFGNSAKVRPTWCDCRRHCRCDRSVKLSIAGSRSSRRIVQNDGGPADYRLAFSVTWVPLGRVGRMLRCVTLLTAGVPAILLTVAGFSAEVVVVASTGLHAQTRPVGYDDAERAFVQLTLDQRVRLQVLLTTAGYWPAVPNEDFSSRLFGAIVRFQIDNGFVPNGILSAEETVRLLSVSGPLLDQWGFARIALSQGSSIWVPLGMGLTEETTGTGFKYSDRANRLTLTYDYFPSFTIRRSFDALLADLTGKGFAIEYSKEYRDEFFVVSASDQKTDVYARYHQFGQGGLGFSLYWNHNVTEFHGERIATLISGSLWASLTGAPFTEPFNVTLKPAGQGSAALPPAMPAATASPPATAAPNDKPALSSGTGFFVTSDGLLLTNAHVVDDCSQIRVAPNLGTFSTASLLARDATNDLALLKTAASSSQIASFRGNIRLGENVEAFGYPLTNVLASSGNFAVGNVTGLSGLGDDSRYVQVSVPVQLGNSGGPLLDQSANVIGVVSGKLNALKIMLVTKGDIPQNVNFAIKASIAANFLQSNGIKFKWGDSSQPMQPADIADQAKAMSVYVECRH